MQPGLQKSLRCNFARSLLENADKEGDDMRDKIKMKYTLDEEANVWFVTSEDVPGFVLEHESFDALCERVRTALPDFLEEINLDSQDISLDYKYKFLKEEYK